MILYKDTKNGKKTIERLKSFIVNKASGIKKVVSCCKCSGTGYIKGFSHIQNGVCFTCSGSGKVLSYKTSEQKQKNYELKQTIKELEEKKVLEDNEFEEWLKFDWNPYVKNGYKQAEKYFNKLGIWNAQTIMFYVHEWISNSINQIKHN